MEMTRNLVPPSLAPGAASQPATIVSEAAAILDEEMAKGVLAARGANRFRSRPEADHSRAVLRELHDAIDGIARIWPTMSAAPAPPPGASMVPASHDDDDGLANLAPASVLRPGQSGTIAMMLCNNEDRSVRLAPKSTDLISSAGGRLSSQLFEFVPAEVRLDPGEKKEVQGRIAIPVDSASGCYVGLWVITGVDYLRALITIEVG
jgi:hypothetical protein